MKMRAAIWMAGALLAAGAARAEAPPADPAARSEADLAARAAKLTAAARESFQAGDYAASRRLALAALQLEPGNAEADALHRESIHAERKVKACRRVGEKRVEQTPEAFIERMTRARAAAEPAGDAARKPDWQAAAEKRLAEKVSVGFKEARFSEVKDYLEGLLGCPIVLDRRLRDKLMLLPVSLTAKDMPLEQVLTWIVENDLGARWALADGAVFVSDADGVTERAGVTEAYDVSDLLYLSEMPDFPGPDLNPATNGAPLMGVRFDDAAADEPAPRRGLTAERLMQMIERAVEPGTWRRPAQEVRTEKEGKAGD